MTASGRSRIQIFTIGFTKRTATEFFGELERARIEHLVDVRLSNTSQLAGYTKRGDLEFFLERVGGISYRHEPLLSPTRELFDDRKRRRVGWQEFEKRFRRLMVERRVEDRIDPSWFRGRTVLLCSEASADECHRSIVADYLANAWGGTEVTHL
jgi:uncharacterized protein (DUF488 family)